MSKSERVVIGVHAQTGPQGLAATLKALRINTEHDVDVVVLADGPDEPLAAMLRTASGIPQSGTAEALGAAACFNRLVSRTDADWYVFLESGSIVGPGWWRRIAQALAADCTHGLGGPSTNRCWNEQCAFPTRDTSYATMLCNAYAAASTYGRAWRRLTPLYSLSDFCYVVGRDVIRTIGAADEGYGLGPCWEMDYNIRAARAGFHGVWACGAYVHRLPLTPLRAAHEAALFEQSRMRYQDKFCALRLDGTQNAYEPGCRGDACEHFAPGGRINVYEPLRLTWAASGTSTDPHPLASCVMVTGGRPEFVTQAIHYFRRQDYPSKELVIVDDGPVDMSARFTDPDICYRYLPARESIGAKRNRGCELTRGTFIAQWDDDDWYGAERLSRQVQPLLDDRADVSGLRVGAIWDLDRGKFWRCSDDLHRRMFVEDVQGGTLVFRRDIWERGVRYPDTSLAEDADFLTRAMRSGARLERMRSEGSYIYVRHGGNTWTFVCGESFSPDGWTEIPGPSMDAADRAFYRSVARRCRPARQVSGRLHRTAAPSAG
jgi:glycosyltransferase involved in cell wall biosynthesis